MFDYSKLRGRITEKYGTHERFAQAIGMNRSTLSQKLNNSGDFTQTEMKDSATCLGFGMDEIPAYFFTMEVAKCEQEAVQ